MRAEVIKPDILREGRRSFTPRLRGRRIEAVRRRAKNVIIELDEKRVIAVNLGMTGRLLPFSAPPRGKERPSHPAVRFRFASGGILIFDDTRRFGTVECLTDAEWAIRSARFGPEPLDPAYVPEQLIEALGRSRSPIRSWLLDQRRVAGVGNIYAAEALFLSGVHPMCPANRITPDEATRLHEAIRSVLAAAIKAGGTTIRDYRNADGDRGEYSTQLYVYGRDGETCLNCDDVVERFVLSNRSAFFCPTCQPDSR